MNIKSIVMTASTFAAAAAFGHAHANLLTNGDFEYGSLTGGTSGGFGPFLTLLGGNTSINGWVIGGGGVNLWTDYKGTGNHVIDMIADVPNVNGSLAQTFSTSANQQYHVSFDVSGANNPGLTSTNNPVKEMDVTIFGSDLSTILITQHYIADTSGWNGNFQQYSFDFQADGSQSQIKFLGTNSGFNGYYIDDVTISSVPVPPAALLLSSGALALIGLGRPRIHLIVPAQRSMR